MQPKRATVYIVDDDASIRRAMERLLRSAGLEVRTFPSADGFLESECRAEQACVVADVRMEGMSGLELQRRLKKSGDPRRFIFITAQDTEETRAEAIRAGGVAFFVKPVDDQALLDAIHWALAFNDNCADCESAG